MHYLDNSSAGSAEPAIASDVSISFTLKTKLEELVKQPPLGSNGRL
jgi:hypothetical protein